MTPHHAPPVAPTVAARPPARRPPAGVIVGILAALAASAASATDLPPGLVADFTRQVQPLLLNKCAAGACHGGPTAHPPRFQRAGVGGQFDRPLTLTNIATLDEAIRSTGTPAAFLSTISARHPASSASSSRLQLVPLTPAERTVLERWITAAAGRRPAPFAPFAATPIAPSGGRPVTMAAAASPAATAHPTAAAAIARAAPDDDSAPPAADPAPGPRVMPSATPASASTGADADGTPPAAKPRPGTVAGRPNRFRAMLDAAANPPALPPPTEPKGLLLRDSGE